MRTRPGVPVTWCNVRKEMWHCCYPLDDVSSRPNIKTLLRLLQEHSRRCFRAIFLYLLFQASLKFVSSCCIFLIIYVNEVIMPFVVGGLRLTSGRKQATSVAHKVSRNSSQKPKTLSSTRWRNKNADDVCTRSLGKRLCRGKSKATKSWTMQMYS